MEEEEEDWSCVFTFSCPSCSHPFVCVTYLAWHRGIFPVQCYTHQISLSQIEIYHLWTVAARDPLSGREALHGNTGKSTCHLMMSVFPIGLPRKLLGAAAVGLLDATLPKSYSTALGLMPRQCGSGFPMIEWWIPSMSSCQLCA